MEILEILRIIFGFALVLFIPGFALTLALWPKTKREVYTEVLKALKEKDAKEVCIVGSEDEVDELLLTLNKANIKAEIYDKDNVKEARNLVLAGNIEDYGIEIDPKGKFTIDLADNLAEGKKIEDTIDIIERIALSFGLSIAIVPLIGLILDKTYGIRLPSILASLLLVTILFFGIYYYRRKTWTINKLSSSEPI
jgi:hypothetical protein